VPRKKEGAFPVEGKSVERGGGGGWGVEEKSKSDEERLPGKGGPRKKRAIWRGEPRLELLIWRGKTSDGVEKGKGGEKRRKGVAA